MFDWENSLRQISQKIIVNYQEAKAIGKLGWRSIEFSPEVIESGWLGFPGASEEQIIATETRLGIILPPSYKMFLKITNGWPQSSGTLRLLSIEEIGWLHTDFQDWIDAWVDACKDSSPVSDEEYFNYEKNWGWDQPIRMQYLQNTLQISEEEDGDVVLLNPEIIHNNEWEGLIWSNGRAGIKRCRSFQEMIQKFRIIEDWR